MSSENKARPAAISSVIFSQKFGRSDLVKKPHLPPLVKGTALGCRSSLRNSSEKIMAVVIAGPTLFPYLENDITILFSEWRIDTTMQKSKFLGKRKKKCLT